MFPCHVWKGEKYTKRFWRESCSCSLVNNPLCGEQEEGEKMRIKDVLAPCIFIITLYWMNETKVVPEVLSYQPVVEAFNAISDGWIENVQFQALLSWSVPRFSTGGVLPGRGQKTTTPNPQKRLKTVHSVTPNLLSGSVNFRSPWWKKKGCGWLIWSQTSLAIVV